jgi:hypothetical protein
MDPVGDSVVRLFNEVSTLILIARNTCCFYVMNMISLSRELQLTLYPKGKVHGFLNFFGHSANYALEL